MAYYLCGCRQTARGNKRLTGVHVAREHEIHAGRVQQRLGVEAEGKLLGLVVVLDIGVVPSSINNWPRFHKTP